VSGATIMGDGHVALILDIAALVQMAKASLPAAA
jgi:chemotaxis protein histidine kinase CheA